MSFSEEKIESLKERVRSVLSPRRFLHTLGVEAAAVKISGFCLPEATDELRAAALLHDVTKELSVSEQAAIMQLAGLSISDFPAPAVHHSVTAPTVILRDFPEYATKNVLSAVYNHTTAAPDMSLFDEILFVADYVEDGRTYSACVAVRESLYEAFVKASNREECVAHLHCATLAALDNTIAEIARTGKLLDERTVAARNAFLERQP